jgi:hypothetical protein
MITLTRSQVRRLRSISRRSTLGISHRGTVGLPAFGPVGASCNLETMPVRLGRALVLVSLLLAPGCGDDGADWRGVGTDGKARDSTAPAAGPHRSQTDGSK